MGEPRNTLEISDYETASAALRNHDLAQALYDDGAVIMDQVLLTLHGEAHRKRRLLEFRVFRRDFFRYYEQELFPRTLHETLSPFLVAGAADLVEFGYRVTINLTADFAGIDRPLKSIEETERLLRLVKTFSEGATLVHSKRDHATVRAEVRAALEEFDTHFLGPSATRRQALIDQFRAGDLDEDALPRDVLTVLLRNQDKVERPPDLLRREMAFYMQAGSHSTANSMTHAMHEILTWTADRPDEAERIRKDPLYLQRCVHESLRLHPASPVAWRRPLCPVELADGSQANEEDRIVLDLHSANQNTEIFGPDADQFNPHRSVKVPHQPFGLTFGIGVHTCLGRDLDGGVVPRKGANPENHQLGIVAMLVRELLARGATTDPADPPTPDVTTLRPNWGRYPVRFA